MKQRAKKILAMLCAITLVVAGTIDYQSVRGEESIPENQETSVVEESSSEESSAEVEESSVEEESSSEEVTTEDPVPGQSAKTHAAGSLELTSKNYIEGATGANQYKGLCASGTIQFFVNIQQPGDATEPGIYVVFKDADFGDVTINGAPMDCYYDGAGIVMYLSNFQYMYNDVVVTKGDGSEKAVLYIYNKNGIDNSDQVIVPETPTGDGPVEITMNKVGMAFGENKIGNYSINFLTNMEFNIGVNPYNNDHIRIQNITGPYQDNFAAIVVKRFFGVEEGKQYVVSFDITPSEANGSYKMLGAGNSYVPLKEGTTTVTAVRRAYKGSDGVVSVDINFYANMLGEGVVLDINNPQIRLATEEDLTTTAPTTPAPTTPAPTTPKPTTQKPTTEVPSDDTTTVTPVDSTTEEPTVVVPTTAVSKKVAPPKQTKVKKATRKAAKKVKLSIKKVKGAKGYKVQFSKKKKFSKKNIVLTKIVRNANPTIKNSKLKKAKKLYVRVKAYKLNGTKKVWAKKWSKAIKVKVK